LELEKKMTLTRTFACGSDANLFAVHLATSGHTKLCMVAVGNFVSGDGGVLQKMTTVVQLQSSNIFRLMKPSETPSNFSMGQIIPLPYCIPGVQGDQQQQDYEDSCMKAVHHICLAARMSGNPFKCLLMEHMLACNGATLSDRALTMIGKLADQHGFCLIVDEIMTGARTGQMVLTSTAPAIFQRQAAVLTMGKWLDGAVLFVDDNLIDIESTMVSRGVSTAVDCSHLCNLWKIAETKLDVAEKRRSQVLKKINCKEDDCWGKGCLIFAPITRLDTKLTNNVSVGVANRLLPMLELNSPIGFIIQRRSSYTKSKVGSETVAIVKEWIAYIANLNDDIIKVVRYLILCPGAHIQLKQSACLNFPGWGWPKLRELFTQAAKEGLLKRKQSGPERLKYWIVQEIITYAWQRSGILELLPCLSR
jgi:hypothetical protein